MDKETYRCADTGSLYCPCTLAGYGSCITCTRLAGRDYCDCSWQGVCIYNEYYHGGYGPGETRTRKLYKLQKIKWYQEDLVVLKVQVPRGLCQKTALPGSCVFAGNPKEDDFFQVPLTVMRSSCRDSTVELVMRIMGPKTRSLASCGEWITLRGVYRNGLIGGWKLMEAQGKKILCLSRGTGIASAAACCRWAGNRCSFHMIVDTANITRQLAEDCLRDCRPEKTEFRPLQIGDGEVLAADYDLVIVCGSTYYTENMNIPPEKKVVTNNFSMCCGEGICGGCTCTDSKGNSYKMCKCR